MVTFTWDEDDTIFVIPLDTRDLDLDLTDEIATTTFVVPHIEHTLGGPRSAWEPVTTPLSPRLSVVRPWTAHG